MIKPLVAEFAAAEVYAKALTHASPVAFVSNQLEVKTAFPASAVVVNI